MLIEPPDLEIIFSVEPDLESGIFVASWDDPNGGGITTQANTLPELVAAIREAADCHFTTGQHPRKASLQFVSAELQLV